MQRHTTYFTVESSKLKLPTHPPGIFSQFNHSDVMEKSERYTQLTDLQRVALIGSLLN